MDQFRREGKRSLRRDLALFSFGILVAVRSGVAIEWLAEPVWETITK